MRQFFVACSLTLVATATAAGETYVVNPEGTGDFPTIQDAIDAAQDEDIIALTDGTFTGYGNQDIVYQGKAITVMSQSGNPEACVISCEGGRGFFFHYGEGAASVLRGITVMYGNAPDP